MLLSPEICRSARLARDPRFDGKFFTGVKTTKIYCRSICPAVPPKEENVVYFAGPLVAAQAGYRPCLRCRPEAAPGSPAWNGVKTTFDRALTLINQGALEQGSTEDLARRLGISSRYLRQLFHRSLGVSPKAYALYKQCLFAKQLLHQTRLPITQVALASGFKSLRRFNDCFQSELQLTPSQVRKQASPAATSLQLQLSYRPPFNWPMMQKFLAARMVEPMEWSDADTYGRRFQWQNGQGQFTARHLDGDNKFEIDIQLDDLRLLRSTVDNIKRLLDLEADSQSIDTVIGGLFPATCFRAGLRIPGLWSVFEAGVRAVLGQQVSVLAARNLVRILCEHCGNSDGRGFMFPTPQGILDHSLCCMKIPAARKTTLKTLAEHHLRAGPTDSLDSWQAIKGIGPWTIDYTRLRGLSDPDIFLAGDLGVKKACRQGFHAAPSSAAPWRSYLTLQLWAQR